MVFIDIFFFFCFFSFAFCFQSVHYYFFIIVVLNYGKTIIVVNLINMKYVYADLRSYATIEISGSLSQLGQFCLTRTCIENHFGQNSVYSEEKRCQCMQICFNSPFFVSVCLILCPRDDSEEALRLAPVCPSDRLSVCLSVRSSHFTV